MCSDSRQNNGRPAHGHSPAYPPFFPPSFSPRWLFVAQNCTLETGFLIAGKTLKTPAGWARWVTLLIPAPERQKQAEAYRVQDSVSKAGERNMMRPS